MLLMDGQENDTSTISRALISLRKLLFHDIERLSDRVRDDNAVLEELHSQACGLATGIVACSHTASLQHTLMRLHWLLWRADGCALRRT